MIKCIAIDDEPLALGVIKKYSSETPLIELVDTFTDALQASFYLKVQPVDLLFLDIHMPDINGIRFFESLKIKPLVIFTTAFSEFAVKGFELNAIDYLVKPIKFDRFIQAVKKAEKSLSLRPMITKVEDQYIFVKSGYQLIKIAINDIIYIEGLDDYVKMHLHSNSKPILSLMSLKSILEKLPRDRFMRVHRSFIVPLRKISSVRNKTIFLDQVPIPLGDTYLAVVQEWLSKH